MRFENRVAFVTGAGRGIGAAVCRKLASEGAAVAIADMDVGPAEETAGQIRGDGGKAIALVCDVTKRDFVTTSPKIYKGTYLAHPKVDLLRSSAVYVDAPEHLPIELDGEQVGTTPVRFEVVPAALRVRVPA